MKKKMKWLRLGAVLLCLTLCLSACSEYDLQMGTMEHLLENVVQQGGRETSEDAPYVPGYTAPPVQESGRRTIPYEQIQYSRPNTKAMRVRIQQLTQMVRDADTFEQVMEYENEVRVISDIFSTMYSLALLKSCQDAYSTEWEEEYRYCSDASVGFWGEVNAFDRAIIKSAFAEEYRQAVGDYVYEDMVYDELADTWDASEEQKEWMQLGIDYDKYVSTLTVEVNGQAMSMLDIDNITYYEDYQAALQAYGQTHGATYAECYRRMIELAKQMAPALGYSSAAEMYYDSYARDYAPEDIETVFAYVKELFAPLIIPVYEDSGSSTEISLRQCMTTMPEVLGMVDEELAQAWQHMIDYGMYDFEPREEKLGGRAFCTTLPAYETPFLYMYWSDDFASATTVMHEFGHYYDDWLRGGTTVVQNLDIAECYSQGLELLLQEYYGSFTQNADDARAENLRSFVSAIAYQTLLEEFQQKLYEMDTFDENVISQLFAELLEEYGYSAEVDEAGNNYEWIRVMHLFTAPFYTISYVASACVALQIWQVSQQDWQAGADLYMAMIHEDQNQPFMQLVQNAGLRDPFSYEALQDIAWMMADEFGVRRPAAA